MSLNKKSVDDINVKGQRVLCRCDFNVPLDENKNIVPLCKEIYNAKFLSDIIFSENDYALNTLLTLLPQRIEIHLLDSEDEFIKTVKLIFEDRVYICRECNICRTYKMIKMTKQQ